MADREPQTHAVTGRRSDLLGPVPGSMQQITVFSAGIVAGSQHAKAAKAFITYLASPAARPAITDAGLDPMN